MDDSHRSIKAERFIRTLQNGWAYGAIYTSSTERANAEPPKRLPSSNSPPEP
jgi:hypothetical protein